jgi:hypothetical protein
LLDKGGALACFDKARLDYQTLMSHLRLSVYLFERATIYKYLCIGNKPQVTLTYC